MSGSARHDTYKPQEKDEWKRGALHYNNLKIQDLEAVARTGIGKLGDCINLFEGCCVI
jgi:hypothetical protein